MKNHLKIHLVWGFAVAALLLAQLACSSKSSENAVTAQPTPSPTTDLTSASPTPDPTPAAESTPAAVASNTGARSRTAASNTGAKSRTSDSNAEANPGYAPANPAGAAPAPASPSYAPPPPRVFTVREGTSITITTAKTLTTKLDKNGDRFTASLESNRRRRLGDRQARRVGRGRNRQFRSGREGARAGRTYGQAAQPATRRRAQGRSFDQLLHEGGQGHEEERCGEGRHRRRHWRGDWRDSRRR